MQSSSPCHNFSKKHRYRVHSSHPGHFVVMQCSWTLCQTFKVVEHEDLVALVAR